MVLLQDGETLARRDHDVTLGRLEIAGEDLQEGGLSGAVCTDKTITVAFRKFNVYVLKEGLFSYAVGHVVCTDHEMLLLIKTYDYDCLQNYIIKRQFFKREIT